MASAMTWIFLTALASTFFMQGDAITCYTCGLANGRECGDEPDTAALTEVTDCMYCYKHKDINNYGFHTVSRGCITSDTVDTSGVTEVNMGCKTCHDCEETIECICDGDKCNHGNTALVSLTTLIAMLTAIKLFQ